MLYLARKIARAKWEKKDGLEPGDIPADAVTIDLRTTNNALSFWEFDSPPDDGIRAAALAIASGADRLDRLDIAWLNRDNISNEGISIRSSEGRTPVGYLRNTHVDVEKLDLGRLGKVSYCIHNALDKAQFRRFTKKEIISMVLDAVAKGLVSLNELDPKVQEEIKKKL